MRNPPDLDPSVGERRLAAIVFTDVVGYSARMQRDEAGTLALVREDLARMRDLCVRHGGEVLKSTGDGLLLCFASVVQAVTCALEIQGQFADRPVGALQHRIGVHLGDVYRDGLDVAGDGVNIAARLEAKARPGTVCLSQSVYDAVKLRLPMEVEALGPQSFKNIAEPITVYLASPPGSGPQPALRRQRFPLAAAVSLAALAGIVLTVLWLRRHSGASAESVVAAPVAEAKSIAVLPFDSIGENKDNAAFADGMHEDLLTHLANVGGLKVISRTSVMQYRGTAKNIRTIAQELGATYVLEGSVRRDGDKVRVTGELINAVKDEHVWAKTYDRDLVDVFVLQSRLAEEITSALQVALSPRERARLDQRPTTSLEAYDLFQQAMAIDRKGVIQATLAQALPLLERAVELDPRYAKAWARIAEIQGLAYWREDRSAERLARMKAAQARAEEADPEDDAVLRAGIWLAETTNDRDQMKHYRQRLIELYPNQSQSYAVLADSAVEDQRWADALAAARKARELDPFNRSVLETLEHILLTVRRYNEAAKIEAALVQLDPGNYGAALRLACVPLFDHGSSTELKALLARLPESHGQSDTSGRDIRVEVMVMLGDADGLAKLAQGSEGGITFFRDYSRRNARMLVAAAYLARGEPALARPLLEENRDEAKAELAVHPDSPSAYNDLGLALSMLGDQAGGRAALARVRETPNLDRHLYWQNVVNRAWAGEKAETIAGLRKILRSPEMAELQTNVYRLRLALLTLPLHGDRDFEAMLQEPANNAPFY